MERISLPELGGLTLEFDFENRRSFGPCSCCSEMTSRVWGYVYRADEALAGYFVEWTPGHALREATFDLILGSWGEGTGASDRVAVSLGFRHLETGPAFMVQNASARPAGTNSLVSKALDRQDVLGTPLADTAFAVCDLIYLADPRIEGLRNSEIAE